MSCKSAECQNGKCCCSKPSVNGILNINKPAGITSFDVVALVRRLTHCRRTGHAGTLDPDATGVLVVCLGQGTRMVELLGDSRKTYVAEIQLGVATDTYDASGRVTSTGDCSGVDISRLQEVLVRFTGAIRQVPPMYSALKFHGKPLYQLARAGIEMELADRPVNIYKLELTSWTSPTFEVRVECGKGTYIRSLAHDIGKELGCGGHMKVLKRTSCGGFDIADSVTPEELEADVQTGKWLEYLHPVDSAALHLPAVILDGEKARMARSGRSLELEVDLQAGDTEAGSPIRESPCRAYDENGEFVALIEYRAEEHCWHPFKVFQTGEAKTCESSS